MSGGNCTLHADCAVLEWCDSSTGMCEPCPTDDNFTSLTHDVCKEHKTGYTFTSHLYEEGADNLTTSAYTYTADTPNIIRFSWYLGITVCIFGIVFLMGLTAWFAFNIKSKPVKIKIPVFSNEAYVCDDPDIDNQSNDEIRTDISQDSLELDHNIDFLESNDEIRTDISQDSLELPVIKWNTSIQHCSSFSHRRPKEKSDTLLNSFEMEQDESNKYMGHLTIDSGFINCNSRNVSSSESTDQLAEINIEEEYERFWRALTRLGPTMPFIDYIQSTYKSSKKIYVNVEREFADEAKQYFSIHIQDIWHKSLLVVVAQDPVEYYMFPSGRNMAGRDPSLTTKSCVEAGNRIIAIPFSEAFTPAHLNDAVKREISLNDVMKRYDINVDSGSLGGFVQDSSGRIYALTARHVVKGKIKYNVIETTSRVHGTETGTIDIPTNDAMGSSNAMYNPEPVGAMGGLNLPRAMADLGNMQSPYYTIMPELSRRIGDMGTLRQGWLNGRDVEMQAPRCIGIAKNDNLAMSKGIVRPKSISLEVENNKFYGLNNNPKNNDKNPGIGIHPSTFLNPGVEPSSGRDAENLPLLTETLEEICDKNSHPDKKGKIYITLGPNTMVLKEQHHLHLQLERN